MAIQSLTLTSLLHDIKFSLCLNKYMLDFLSTLVLLYCPLFHPNLISIRYIELHDGSKDKLSDRKYTSDYIMVFPNFQSYHNIYTCQCPPFNEQLSSNCLLFPIKAFVRLATPRINKRQDWSTLCSIDITSWRRLLNVMAEHVD